MQPLPFYLSVHHRLCALTDQAYLDDALKSAILGQIMRWRAIDACMSDNWAPGNQTAGPGQGNGYWRKLIMKALENATSCPGSQTSDTYIDHPAKTVMRNQLSRSARLVRLLCVSCACVRFGCCC